MRRKQEKFKENALRSNVIQPGKDLFEKIKGQWRTTYFKNDGELVLELGCGRGEYTVGMAAQNPRKNFIGIDLKGDRIWKGSKTAEAQQLQNVAFLRTQVQLLEHFFEPGEANEIWITFPDPRPKKRDIRRRMTHPRFMQIYQHILAPDGYIHLKTDNQAFFEYSLEVLAEYPGVRNLQYTQDIYTSPLMNETLKIQTHYEELFSGQGYSIKYLKFQF